MRTAKVIFLSSTTDSIYLAPLVAVSLEAGFASNVVGLPISTSPFQVKRTAFSNKAFNITEISTDVKVIAIGKNSFGLVEGATSVSEEAFAPTLNDSDFDVKVVKINVYLNILSGVF